MFYLLPEKEKKISYSILKVVSLDNMAARKGNLCEVQSLSPYEKVKRWKWDMERWNTAQE